MTKSSQSRPETITTPLLHRRCRSRSGAAIVGLAALTLLLLPPCAVEAEPPVRMSEPFVVNEVVERDQHAPRVAPRPDGGFVAVWKGDPLTGGVFGRIFDGDGEPAGPEFSVIEETVGHRRPSAQGLLALAADDEGGFAVVWTESQRSLDANLFDPAGRPSNPAFEVTFGLEADQNRLPAAAWSPNGRLWVAWAWSELGGDGIRVRSFERDGRPASPPVEIEGLSFEVALAVAADGSVLVVWAERSVDRQRFAVRARLRRPGVGWGEDLAVVENLDRAPRFLLASAGPSGDFAVGWQDLRGIAVQRLDETGALRGSSFRVSTDSELVASPAMAHDGSGNLLVSWVEELRIRGRCFDEQGTAVGEELLVSPDSRFAHRSPAVAGLPAGGFVVLWEADFGDGDDGAVLGRILAPPSPGVVGLTTTRYVVREGDGRAAVSVARTQGAVGAATVEYRVRGETALVGDDFEAASGELAWGDGEGGFRSFTVPVVDDGRREDEEHAIVELLSVGGGAVLGLAEARLVVRDDDGLARPGAASRQLSAADVECDRIRLVGLLERIDVAGGVNLALTATGDPFGVAYRSGGEDLAETVLSFSANAEETPLLRNPARPQLPTVSLTRNDLATTLIQVVRPPGQGTNPRWLQVALDPTLDGGARTSTLRIDNALEPDELYRAGQSTDTKPGRGLLPLLEPCHGKLTARDVHLLRVLARALRLDGDASDAILYRGEEPGQYVIETFTFHPRTAVVLDLLVTFDARGGLLEGTLRARERCPPLRVRGCTRVDDHDFVSVSLAGVLTRSAGGQAAIDPRFRVVLGDDIPIERPEITFDWRELLAGTTWRNPL